MKIEPRYTAEEQQRIHERVEHTIKQKYIVEEQQEAKTFVKELEERIEQSREAFFWNADNASERRQNKGVEDREKIGDPKFSYGSTIHSLVLNLVSINLKQRRKIMREIMGGVNYTIRGIEVDTGRLEERSGYAFLMKPFFADVASSPLEYFNIITKTKNHLKW